jgi:hypothetical protein
MRHFFFLALLCCGLSLSAQPYAPEGLRVGLGFTAGGYLGDLTEAGFVRVYPGFNFSLHREGVGWVQAQFIAGFGKFAEQLDDAPVGAATSFFETQYFHGDLRLRFRFWPQGRWQPYAGLGAGVLYFIPRDASGDPVNPPAGSPEPRFNTVVPQLPATAGLQLQLNDYLSGSFDYTFRYTPTDYLDNLSEGGFDALHSLVLSLYLNFGAAPQN